MIPGNGFWIFSELKVCPKIIQCGNSTFLSDEKNHSKSLKIVKEA
ncbi:hypothetical protein LEP1GSC016_1340 [Leptospira borgpetersenii serovar Hardjo-bovis str. Sponselee]|uniref:Uncharacterized protein n=2 Tax=Leptospira TaxID=171 RepID=A0AA87MM49_9LEPT|nr:hypothetical protein LEP1GSC125_2365 [Leptospira mayottensis 200901122]EMJ78879.1 hypothetical protein LEP1GSC016_1340 [Leptospira borgpetersenii serovar Hardjo-bovis str. Sponselee]